ncbi:LysR family transcriptional regulator [Lactococcus garvieae]|uniref:LysR family transcriptional regulator n=1 Tax=Lactococcus garvieae TaxID=1363 RepID=UPI0009BEA01B|nr:LysR family transcriptional regulator [Lactococcus garvieae]
MFSLFETFIAIYETRSFTKAGQYLFISQPTVTVRIKKLEEELGNSLFIRGKNKEVIPTEAAKLLYNKAVKYIQDWEQLQSELSQTTMIKKPFKVGVSQSTATSIMPVIYTKLLPYLDRIDLEIAMYDSQKVFSLVEKHDLHFGIIEKTLASEQVEDFPLMKDELVLAGDVSSDTFFTREVGSGVGHYIKKYLQEKNYKPKYQVRMNNNDMIIAHIRAGLGVSLISKRFVSEGMTYQALDSKYHRTFSAITYAEEKDPLMLEIIQQIRESVK